MNRSFCVRLLIALLPIIAPFIAAEAWARASRNVPPDDSVYRLLDVGASYGLIDDLIVGQRPYSRHEVARALRQMRSGLPQELRGSHFEQRLSAQEVRFQDEIEGNSPSVSANVLSRVSLKNVYDRSDPRLISVSNGLGLIDGTVASFDRYKEGIPSVRGLKMILATEHTAQLSPYVALHLEPRFDLLFPHDGGADAEVHPHRLYSKAGWKNIELEVGRDNLLWGQGRYGGIMLSSHPRALDMISLSNPHPWRAPWLFRYLGPQRWGFFVANLGPEDDRRYAYLYGLKWSLKPARILELGLSETIVIGGEGSPDVRPLDPVEELFPLRKVANNLGQRNVSNHAFGLFDMRLTIPPLRGSVLYYDGHFEDSFLRAIDTPDNLMNQMSFIAGWYFPRLDAQGKWGLRVEGHHLSPMAYRHGRWTSGYTLNKRPLGSPLASAAEGGELTVLWEPTEERGVELQMAFEDFDSSGFRTESNEEGGGGRVLKETPEPHERRYRLLAHHRWEVKQHIGLQFDAGYEYITNFNFRVGKTAHHLLIGMGLDVAFERWTLKSRDHENRFRH